MSSPVPVRRTDGIIAASRRKAETAEKAARAAIAKLRRSGTAISVAAVAREAGVSQHYLHQHPDLGPLIRSIRNASTTPAPTPPAEPSQSGIVSVLRARIEAQNPGAPRTAAAHQRSGIRSGGTPRRTGPGPFVSCRDGRADFGRAACQTGVVLEQHHRE